MVLRNAESILVDFGALFFVARQREDHPGTPAFTAVEIADAARSGEAIHPDPGFLANRMHRVSLRRSLHRRCICQTASQTGPSRGNEPVVGKINKRIVTLMEFLASRFLFRYLSR